MMSPMIVFSSKWPEALWRVIRAIIFSWRVIELEGTLKGVRVEAPPPLALAGADDLC